jgi:hypothetical protein
VKFGGITASGDVDTVCVYTIAKSADRGWPLTGDKQQASPVH